MKKYKKKKKSYMNIKIIAFIFIFYFIKYCTNEVPYLKIVNAMMIYLIVILGGILFFKVIAKQLIKAVKKQRYLNSSLYQIDRMKGTEFEEYLKAHFEKKGYNVKTTPLTADYGVDLICKKKKSDNADWDNFVVQAKRYSGYVGIKAVQEIIGGMSYYGYENGMVVTNSYYSKNAKELAKKSNVILLDRNDLRKNFE